jgi:hypothetical protein
MTEAADGSSLALRQGDGPRLRGGTANVLGVPESMRPPLLLPRQKLCDFCHTPLPPRSHHQTKYHRNCREVIKWQAAKLYKSRMQQDGTP